MNCMFYSEPDYGILQQRFRIILALICLMLFGCHTQGRGDGHYELQFAWDGGLRHATILRSRVVGEVTSDASSVIMKQAQPEIAEQMKRANLTNAQGTLQVTLTGPPPYTVLFNGIQISTPDIASLFVAVDRDDSAEIQTLVSKYNNVNQRELPSQRTALYMAAVGGRLKSIETLLSLGADPNIPDHDGYTPLHATIAAGSLDATRLLIARSAKVDYANKIGWTPLMLAANLGNTEGVRILLDAGASRLARSEAGKTAQELAAEQGHQEAVRILERR